MPKILAFSGSSRTGSFNQKLVTIAADAAREEGADVTVINLGDYQLPIYNADAESSNGLPEHAKALKQILIDHDGFLIASPEYNSAFSPLLKNAIDWASRKENDQERPLAAYKGKYAAIMSASPGALGGLRGLVFLRMLLSNIGVLVLPEQHAISNAHKAFDGNGQLENPVQQQAIRQLGSQLVRIIG